MIHIRECSHDDIPLLAGLNKMLIEDEKAENNMDIPQLELRMAGFLESVYRAFFFFAGGRIIGYALCDMSKSPVYLRQFFICRGERRKGYGKKSFEALLEHLLLSEIDIDVYAWNEDGIVFWESLGFKERYYNMRYSRREGQGDL